MNARLATSAIATLVALSFSSASAESPERSLKPQVRPAEAVSVSRNATDLTGLGQPRQTDPMFRAWVDDFRPLARAAGIPDAVIDSAFAHARYLPDVIERDRNQAEFVMTIWDYLDRTLSESRIANGRDALRLHGDTLERIEAHYGVEKEVVAAIWGMESAYGTHRGDTHIVSALATLAYDGRRASFFEQQLISALKIIASGDVNPGDMTGSWAGAMGHTQFIPTSYEALAVDFTGDGKRDIWSDDPTDALASTAAYLAHHGWTKGMPWGVEVTVPAGFDYAQAGKDTKKMPSDWARLGVVGTDGAPVRDFGSASLLLPAGAQGAAFLVFKNFRAIAAYNAADAYVLGVGHLSDRLAGKGPLTSEWPRGDRSLTFSERQELQRRLTAHGYDTQGVDGRIGPMTMSALKSYQRSAGLAPDGYASLSVLKRLR
jgi:lytic murein transglycosylase